MGGRIAAWSWIAMTVTLGCDPVIPDGVYACDDAADCPRNFVCSSNRCFRAGVDAGEDGSTDASLDTAGDGGCECMLDGVCVPAGPVGECGTCTSDSVVLSDDCPEGASCRSDGFGSTVCCTGCARPASMTCEPGTEADACGTGGGECLDCGGASCSEGRCCRNVQHVAGGDRTVCVIDDDGGLWCWGHNQHNQVGSGAVTIDSPSPITGGGVSSWRFVDTNGGPDSGHTCAISEFGDLYCWGDNTHGQLGTGDTMDETMPTTPVAPERNWIDVAVASRHTCGIRSPGDLYCWGLGANGRLGTGNTDQVLSPVRIGTENDWTHIECNIQTCCGIRDGMGGTGALHCWGGGMNGQIGDGSDADRDVPTFVTNFASDVAVGGTHSCAVVNTPLPSQIYCWGANAFSQLGLASEQDTPTTPTIAGRRVWAGKTHTCALATDGLYCWGDGADGKLGTGLTMTTVMAGLVTEDVVGSLAAGTDFTCAVTADATLQCWGNVPGAEPSRSVPQPVCVSE